MKKITSISLQGTVFQIEEDAYKSLDVYLKSIKKHFAQFEDSTEIITDIESRIAEKFSTEVLTGKHKSITKDDVDSLVASMGTTEDFSDTEEVSAVETDINSSPKRLYRNPEDAVVAGVASGMSAYLHIDPVFIRLLFAVLIFAGGWGVIIYIICWIAIPEAKTPTQQMEMRGSSITLSSLEKSMRDRVGSLPQSTNTIRRATQSLAEFSTSLIAVIARYTKPAVRVLAGLGSLGVSFAILGLSISAFAFLFNVHHSYIDEPTKELFSIITTTDYYALITSGYLSALIPLIALLLIGIAIALWKNLFRLPVIITLGIVFIVSFSTATLLTVRYAPLLQEKAEAINTRLVKETESARITKDFDLSDFTAIKATGNTTVIIKNAPVYSVTAEGLPEDVEKITMTTGDSILNINVPEHYISHNRLCFFNCYPRPAIITVSIPVLTEVTGSGNVTITSDGETITSDTILLNLESGAFAYISLNTRLLSVELTDSARVDLEGTVQELNARLSDNSSLTMSTIELLNANILTEDYSDADIAITEQVTATANDYSTITISGDPEATVAENDYGEVTIIDSPLSNPEI